MRTTRSSLRHYKGGRKIDEDRFYAPATKNRKDIPFARESRRKRSTGGMPR